MSIICRFFAHAPIPSRLWNGGYYFTKCSRCECDLIRRGSSWTEVPAGYQVVWREVQGPPVDWTPWSPTKVRKDPSITEILASIVSERAPEAPPELVVDPRAGAVTGEAREQQSPDLYPRRVA